ncbi:unnamed protein product [Strongylus vulgaris]|uniref:C2H2-type domain-containing protein n=1 Tax=Strongylus vulgaris TaxID=40348 RepID=A0A3P7LZX9_STRVU|nr:unnamed protein product [Strongylus vulgaris]
MLRRLKAQVSQVANELPGVLSPSARENRDDSSFFSSSDTSQNNGDDEIEGFLCPICMVHYNSPESLSEHFEEAHNKETSLVNPNFDNATIISSLSTVTQRMLEFEKENGQLKRSVENGNQERAEIMVKLKQLSGQIRALTDENEGNKV